MIDIHSHILPGLDDGSQDMKETLEMIRKAEMTGVTAMVATPHCNIPKGRKNYFDEDYKEAVHSVQLAVKQEGLNVEIYPGMEVFATPDLPQLLREGRIMTLNGGRYLLVEFDFNEDPDFAVSIIEEIRATGVIPVIAHAERYKFVQRNPNIVYHWRTNGYPIQVNKGSFKGSFGGAAMDMAYNLMDCNLVSVVASDAHSQHWRTTDMSGTYERLIDDYSQRYLDMVFRENPGRICRNEPILGLRAKRIE